MGPDKGSARRLSSVRSAAADHIPRRAAKMHRLQRIVAYFALANTYVAMHNRDQEQGRGCLKSDNLYPRRRS
jgi:hypothetical protein